MHLIFYLYIATFINNDGSFLTYLELIVTKCGQWTNFFGVALSSLHQAILQWGTNNLFQRDFDRGT